VEPIFFALLVVTTIGNTEPIFTFKPAIAFDTLERCEEQLINDLSEGDHISTYDYFSQNRRMISSQTQFKKTFATCIETSVPWPLVNKFGNNSIVLPLALNPLKTRPRSRPEDLAVSEALNTASISSDTYSSMRDAIAGCWNVGALSPAVLSTIVEVEIELTLDGKPVPNSIKMLGFEGGDEISAKLIFETALRAIQRCGAQGFELPRDQYDAWRRMVLIFNSDKMRAR
jgi:hypothetical protein